MHAPASHFWPDGHIVPPPPQFAGSASVGVQLIPHSFRPGRHVHTPALQPWPEPGQYAGHPPQEIRLCVLSKQAAEQNVPRPPQSHCPFTHASPGGQNAQTDTGTVADRRLAQLDQVDKMEKTLGRKVDPYDVGALRDYFQKVKADGGMKAAGQEYNQYLQNFTKHPGGVENNWVQNKADLDDPTKMASVMKNQTRDASGRMLLDCEGTTFLTGQIFGAKPSSAGNEVWFTADQQHIAATVIDPKTGEGFHVNTAKSRKEYVTEIPKPTPKNENDRKAVAWGFFSHNGEAGKQGMPGGSFIPGKDYALTRKVEEARMTD